MRASQHEDHLLPSFRDASAEASAEAEAVGEGLGVGFIGWNRCFGERCATPTPDPRIKSGAGSLPPRAVRAGGGELNHGLSGRKVPDPSPLCGIAP
jgi:hypothetical protein